jgi:hypothetical protein
MSVRSCRVTIQDLDGNLAHSGGHIQLTVRGRRAGPVGIA